MAAGLADRVNRTLKRNASGQLVEEAVTPTSQLAGQAGLVAPPTTPAGVGALGGTNKQIDMAGSVNQKASALRQSADTQNTLGEAEADKRYRSNMTAGEQGTAEKQKRLGEVFGSTQEKVANLVSNEIAKQAAAAAPAQFSTAGVATATAADKQAEVDTAFAALLANPTDLANVEKLTQLTGMSDAQIRAAAQDAAVKQGSAGAVGQAAANATNASNINVAALLPDLGTGRDELAQLLGLDPAAIDSMGIDELNAAVAAVATQGAEPSVRETNALAGNRSVGAAERAAYREAGIEQATSGAAESEAQLESLAQSLENADTVSFGGKQMTVEELLSDEGMSKLITDYLTNPESPESRRFAADPGAAALIQFAEKYRGALTEAATTVGGATEAHTAVTAANKDLATLGTPGGAQYSIPDSLLAAVYGDTWNTNTTAKQPTGVIASLKKLTPAQLDQAVPLLNAASTDPELAKQIRLFSPEKLLKLMQPGSDGISPFDHMQQSRKALTEIDALNSAQNIDGLINLYFGGDVSSSEKLVASPSAARHTMGLGDEDIAAVLAANPGLNTAQAISKIIYDRMHLMLSTADQPREVMGGSVGWKPKSLSAAVTAYDAAQKAAATSGVKYNPINFNSNAPTTTYVNPITGVVEKKPGMTDEEAKSALAAYKPPTEVADKPMFRKS